jgi:hypothetical protein
MVIRRDMEMLLLWPEDRKKLSFLELETLILKSISNAMRQASWNQNKSRIMMVFILSVTV